MRGGVEGEAREDQEHDAPPEAEGLVGFLRIIYALETVGETTGKNGILKRPQLDCIIRDVPMIFRTV